LKLSTQSAVQPAYVPVAFWVVDRALVVGSGVDAAADADARVEALVAEVALEAVPVAEAFAAVWGVSVAAADVCADPETVCLAAATVATWLALVA
jgi:hypothetical protein